MQSGGITGRLMKGSAWISASVVVGNALGAVSTVVLAANLAVTDFGLVAIATTIVIIVGAITDVSLSQSLVNHRDPGDAHYDTAFTLNMLRGLLLFALFAAVAVPVARFYGDGRLIAVMLALGLSVFIRGLSNPRRALLERQLIFWQECVLNISQRLAGTAVSVAIAILFRSYWALVAGTIVTAVVGAAASYAAVPYRPHLSLRHMRELMSFSIWLTAAQVVNTLNGRVDQLVVGKILGTEPLGYYSVGSNLAALPTREATTPLTFTIFPAFAAIADDRPRLAAAYQRSQAFIAAIALPAGFGTALVAQPLILLTMGERWLPAVFIIQILAAATGLQTLGSLAQPLGMALGQTRLLFVRDVQMLLFRMPLSIVAMMLFGLPGMILARVSSNFVASGLNFVLVRRFAAIPVRSQLLVNVRALTAVATMTAGVTALLALLPEAVGNAALLLRIVTIVATGALLYVGTLALLWTLAGRPAGPETEVVKLVARIRGQKHVAV